MQSAKAAAASFLLVAAFAPASALAQGSCAKPVYMSFDTGHMGVAPLVADVLKRQDVRVTFFAAAERTQTGGDSLDNQWAPWWKARAAEGHEFASHTYDHAYWRGDIKGTAPRFRIQPSSGAFAGREFTWDAQQYCANIAEASDRLRHITGKQPLPLFRAPGGKTSPTLLAAAKACGYEHVGWSPAGLLGDELPSEKFSNEKLLQQALDRIQPGDILVAHLGIWSRKDPWAPAVLEPLIVGLKAKGFCFETLRQHPAYRAWIASHR
ncbi:putative polysaccharide deacetylase PdaA precursor [Variovorax sp. PBL-H6]|uniref:polysaccharide deacetylase family protein n=1 Tax=Variovorax sp. PBL-H6 TaxID=434009 RepID=UPI001315FEE5|nr:polysaccharide deacetylase family protein [Variovorax sp. PBL-H6]VTU34686.1 putative polysaccharide deacetylase PdaA precursor [Variovorax sp. PBL-H6]